ncbi:MULTISPECIES: MerR family transcriptional regulator [unclassified Clostridium]|uniref:MerR family transcriptional regulator n=1 Tax=Clostridium TaxID=1485 RepID=UPI001C8CD786|nr:MULTISPECIES: MerR family transcriptional regulator [unclassified Clostridium]MBX9136522.1 MerR family transcriptional regulator [Clostridium sp. K12(2020)]MBX9142997.1 MerR family transcriptional regulator [Clostridium sp. K13]MDU2291377.1 MerR family transcriptional regulator [Clostridium celatum]
MEYLIKDASKKLNISIYTLRYYDKEGLTPFVKKDENGVRKYTDEDLEWIRMLINLRDIDMPISNIKEYIELYLKGDETIEQRRDLMCRYREYIKKKVEDTISSLEMATEKLRNYDSVVADILDDTNLFENKKIYNK